MLKMLLKKLNPDLSFKIVLQVCLLILIFFPLSFSVYAETRQYSSYYSSENIVSPSGEVYQKCTISGPPEAPRGAVRAIAKPRFASSPGAYILSDVPAFTWCFGCSATSAAMIAGYYDRHGYSNMYTGPTNGGVMPLNNDDHWSTWSDGYNTRHRCPLSATQKDLDGRSGRGHVDDYWIKYLDSGPDPFVGNWVEHTSGDCTGDFMGTNQASSPMENKDGATTFWNYEDGNKLTAQQLFNDGEEYYKDSGLCGIQEFYESCGYTVDEAYNQKIYPYGTNTKGFSYTQFQNEIDAGRPVMLNLAGHTIVGIGYDTSTDTIIIHDTWDHSQHSMVWGGEYSGMALKEVSIVILRSEGTSGSLDIGLFPADAVSAGAKWRRTGTSTWRAGGSTEENVPVGSHTIEFESVAGWYAPDSVSVTVSGGLVTHKSLSYSDDPAEVPSLTEWGVIILSCIMLVIMSRRIGKICPSRL